MELGLKSRLDDQEPWQRCAATALDTIDRAAFDDKVARLIDEVRQVAKTQRVGYGWSGGKDSQALRWIMEQAGVERSVLGVTPDLEFPAMVQWYAAHMPEGCDVIEQPAFDMRWIRANPEMLFPRGTRGTEWFGVARRSWRQFAKYERLHVLVLGRRRKDDNYIGPPGTDRYLDREGVLRWSPLGLWTHEEVFALIAQQQLAMPPCYDWPRGYVTGTGAWASRDAVWQKTTTDPDHQLALDRDHGFAECWAIDADTIRAAADRLPAAREWMQRHEKE
jgi:3'-phosphoadenosine 5'-phosphosulfate sulfotransferase (PAPS reductase)/FAD synthetase